MAEIERFERDFAAALERYADEVPTAVDAAGLVRSITEVEARRGWRAIVEPWRQLVPAVRYAVVLAILVALVVALGILAQRLVFVDDGTLSTGRMTCTGPSMTTLTAAPARLECQGQLPELDGRVDIRIILDRRTESIGLPAWSGTIEATGPGGEWTGEIAALASWNGLVTGDATLRSSGRDEVTRLHLMSDDGLAWGLLGARGMADAR